MVQLVKDVRESERQSVTDWIQDKWLGMKMSPLRTGVKWQENLENRINKEKQMTTNVDLIGASLAKPQVTWSKLKWPALKGNVFRLQVRIAKADKEGRHGKVRALQRLLTSSFSAKCLAIKRVTSSPGSKTPGVDGKTLRTDQQKGSAILALKRHGYKPQALRRIYIPKKSNPNEQRALSIPTIIDCGQQALHLLSLEPIVENRADPNAYGFRLKRSCHDAVEQCFNALSRKNSSQWILEGDIKSCFDRTNHKYLLKEISMDKVILKKFLKSGYMEGNQLHHTNAGTPQGGTISAALVVIALSGLETNVRSTNDKIQKLEKINMIAYADDFIVTAASKELLENKVKPILAASLAKVGLELSEAKTRITHINDGFDFLGFNVRKYKNRKLLIKPAKAKIRSFLKEIKTIIRKGAALPTEKLIYALNTRLTGWVNYYRTSVSSKGFAMIDREITQALMRWAFKRHARKGKRWIVNHYFTTVGGDNWRFYSAFKDKIGNRKLIYLKKAGNTKIRRHIKIKSDANPFDTKFTDYFKQRKEGRMQRQQHQ